MPSTKTETAKTPKVTARDQGVPEVYLSEAGTFRPGYDAKLKSDLITAVLGSPVLHVWDADEALRVLESRGWMKMLETSREARERKAQA
jgi:hypothetical protein